MNTTPNTHLLQTPFDLSLAAPATSLQPEALQATLMDHISATLLRQPSPPCLLRAPTGAGKTAYAARKAQHFPPAYGKVLFLTPDGNRLRWVNNDGSLGDAVKLTEIDTVRERLAQTLAQQPQ